MKAMVPREIFADPELPQLAAILDPEGMRAALERGLRRGGAAAGAWTVYGCAIDWIKYKAGKNCTVSYRLSIGGSQNSGPMREQRLYGRVYVGGGARARFEEIAGRPWRQPDFGPPVLYLDGLDMLAWLFPNDRKLRGLPGITDRDCLMHVLLPDAVAAAAGPGWRIHRLEHAIMHYVPEHTCTVKADMTLIGNHADERRSLVLYGKAYYNRAGAAAFRVMRALAAPSPADGAALRVAAPCSYRPDYRILWQTRLAGDTLLDLPFGGSSFMAALAPAAAAVAALHRSAVDCTTAAGMTERLSGLRRVRGDLPRVLASGSRWAEETIDALCAGAGALGEPVLATLHGDLHPGNILVDGAAAGLIDLDGLCRGPALSDVGSFIASLIFRSLLHRLAPAAANRIIGRFCRHYQEHISWQLDPDELAWYTATALINERAFRVYSRLKPGRMERLSELFEAARRIGLAREAPRRWLEEQP